MKMACYCEKNTMHELHHNSIPSVVTVCGAVLHQLPKDAALYVCAWSLASMAHKPSDIKSSAEEGKARSKLSRLVSLASGGMASQVVWPCLCMRSQCISCPGLMRGRGGCGGRQGGQQAGGGRRGGRGAGGAGVLPHGCAHGGGAVLPLHPGGEDRPSIVHAMACLLQAATHHWAQSSDLIGVSHLPELGGKAQSQAALQLR